MSFSASTPTSAERPTSLLKKYVVIAGLLLLGCLGIQPVFAAGECSLSPISAQTQYGQGGATLVYSFTLIDNGGCNAESGSVKIISDTTQSATVNKTAWSTGVNKPTSVSVKLGGNIGGQVEVVVSCKNCAAPTSLTFTGVVTGDYLFVAKPLSSINSTVAADTVLPLVVSLTKTGSGIPGEIVVWKQLSGPSTASINRITGKFTDSNGENRIDFKASVTGIYKVRASVCDPADTRFCTELIVDFTIDVGGTPGGLQFNRVSPGTPVSASPGDKVTLTAEYLFKNSGYIGQDVIWSISPLGGASLGTNVTPVTDSSGRVSNVVNIDSPGSYTVTARAKCDGPEPGCQPADIIWLINVGSSRLDILGGDGQTGATNTVINGLTISATTGGSPDGGLPINWSVVAGNASINSTSGPTDTGGKAAADVLFGNTAGTVIVKAERSDNPSIRVFFTLASGVAQLDNLSGTPTVAAGQSISLIAYANLGGVDLTSGRVNWTNNNPGATSIGATSTPVDLTGRASTTFTANQGGLFTVTACYSALGNTTCVGGDPSTTFTINAIALKKTAGDAQTITVANISSPLVVKLESGTVPNPLTIEWTVSGPATLSSNTTPLDGSGNSNNTVTATGPGAITVTASWISSLRAFPTQSVVFNLNAAAAVLVLSPISSNPIVTTVGTPFNAVVRLTTPSSIPVAGANIKFSSTTGVNSTPVIIVTDSNGQADSGAIFTAQVAALLNNVVIAEYDPTPLLPSSGDEVVFRFNVNASAPPVVRTLLNHDGDGQSTSVGLAFPLNVVVQALDNSLSAPDGTQIQYSIDASSTATGTLLSCCGTTSGGFSGVGVTAGTTQGNLVVRAQRVDDPTAFVLFNLTVAPPALQSIAITPANATIADNGAQTFVATGTFSDASTADISATVTWASSNTSLATMSGATANGAGSFTGGATTITATQGAATGTTTLNVTAAPVVLVSIAVTPATSTIASNGAQTFVATGTYNDSSTVDISASVTWNSSNTSLATMTGATANGAGSFTGGATTITATQGAVTGSATLNVNPAAVVLVSIAVTPATSTIASNGSQTYVATGTFNDTSTANISASVTWNSSNTALATTTGATANGAGSFTGGATTITATQGAITGSATLNVNPAAVVLVSIAVTPATSTIASNGSQTYVATGTFSDASTANISASVTWNSSNTALATMTGATAIGAGSFTGGATTITATQGAITGSATLNVNPAAVVLVSIAVTPATSTIASNGSQTYVATGTFNDASTANISASVTWNSSNTALATITGATANGAGSFTGGATTITATQGAVTGSAALNVTAAPAVKTITIISGNGQTVVAGNAFTTMTVSAQDNGVPVSGLSISWTVSGAGSATPAITSSITDTGGIAIINMSSVNPGAITVTAARSDDLTKFVGFNHTINPVPASTLTKQSGDNQQGVLGSVINNALVVRLRDGFGAALTGQTISWSVLSGPATLSGASSLTNAAGDGQISLTFGSSSGVATIRASAISGSLTQDFTASAVTVTLGNASGNGQSGPVSTLLPLPLTVQITPPTGVTSVGPKSGSTKALSGVPITFAVTTGTGALLSVTNTVTNAGGSASTTLTLGPSAGAYVVTASTPGGSTTSFTATATTLAVGTSITKLNGDAQSLTPGNASVLMRVRLLDIANNPVAGAIIQWTAVNGTLTSATSTTNAAGEATNIVTAISSGVVSVSASYTNPVSSLVTGPVTFSHNAGISNLSGLTTEQESIANSIDTLCPALAAITSPTPAQTALLNDCTAIINAASIDPAAASNALDQLIPNIAIAQATATMLAAQSQFQNLKARIAALRSGTQGTSFEGLAFTNGSGTISLGALGNTLTGDDEPNPQLGADFQRWGFFAAGTIGRGEAEAGSINPAFDYDINGLTAGLDYRYSDKFIFGAALGFTRQGSDLNGSEGSLDTTGWSASAYSTFYKENSWYADTVLTYGRNNYDLERRIRYTLPLPGGGFTTIDQTGRSSSSGDMLEAAFTFGHDFQKGGLSIGPYGRVLYTKLGFDQSVETLEAGPGSGLGVVIETRDLTSIASQVGAKFTYSHSTDWGVVIPHVQVEWEHEFKDDPAQITTRFLNDPTATPIVITGDPQDTDYFRIGLGLSMILSKGRSGFFYYEQVLGRDGYSQYNLGLGVRIEF